MILDGDYLHLWCCAHIFNIIVTEGLKEMHDSITSICNAIIYVRSSGLRLHVVSFLMLLMSMCKCTQ